MTRMTVSPIALRDTRISPQLQLHGWHPHLAAHHHFGTYLGLAQTPASILETTPRKAPDDYNFQLQSHVVVYTTAAGWGGDMECFTTLTPISYHTYACALGAQLISTSTEMNVHNAYGAGCSRLQRM